MKNALQQLAQAEMDLARQKTEKAKAFRRRFFTGAAILFFVVGAAGAMIAPGWAKLSFATLFFGSFSLFRGGADRKTE